MSHRAEARVARHSVSFGSNATCASLAVGYGAGCGTFWDFVGRGFARTGAPARALHPDLRLTAQMPAWARGSRGELGSFRTFDGSVAPGCATSHGVAPGCATLWASFRSAFVVCDFAFLSLQQMSLHKQPPSTGRPCAGSTFGAHETLAPREERVIFSDFLVSPFARAASNWRKGFTARW
jgi:hypothetical protein